MTRRSVAVLALLAAMVAAGPPAAPAQHRAEWKAWNRPVEPFRIFGPLHYVGTAGIAVYAIATPAGLIVLDGGFPETAPLVEASLAKLGFDVADVEILLNSHAHFDHAGGLAALAAKSGAQVVAHERDAAQLEAGGRGDFAWGDDLTYPPVAVGRRIRDGDTVTLGGVTLTAHLTAGHTKGCTTWTARFAEGGVERDAVFVCSTSVPDPEGYRLAGNPRYPEIAGDYERAFATLRALPCDLFLAAHGWDFDLEGKLARRARGGGMRDPFVDPAGFRAYVEKSEARFRELLEAARSPVPTASPSPAPPTTSTNSPGSDGRAASSASSAERRP